MASKFTEPALTSDSAATRGGSCSPTPQATSSASSPAAARSEAGGPPNSVDVAAMRAGVHVTRNPHTYSRVADALTPNPLFVPCP